MSDLFDAVWDELLSRQPDRIREAYRMLDPAEQAQVAAHLEKMASEAGWHPEQVISAKTALEAIRDE